MPYYEYDESKNAIVEVPDIYESEIQPPEVKKEGQRDQQDPKFRRDVDERLRKWSIENKL